MFAALPPQEGANAEEIFERFEDALIAGKDPNIDDFAPSAGDERRTSLLELSLIELEYRLKKGRLARAEDYLGRFPELESDPDAAVELIASEYDLRSRDEPGLALDSYLQRFSRFGHRLRSRLEAVSIHLPPKSSALSRSTATTSAAAAQPQLPDATIVEELTRRGYSNLRWLGRGGMGNVYRAFHSKLHKEVAIKVLLPQLTDHPHALARFEQEMRSAGQLDHPNIVRAIDAADIGGRHFLVMEYVEGPTLAVIAWHSGIVSVADACELVRQAAIALTHVHEAGLVHRDVKPSNLILTRKGEVKLLDLGLARLHTRDDDKAALTTDGQVMGTIEYMAPEQVDDSHGVDARADLYALGCTLYQLLCGQPPIPCRHLKNDYLKMRAVVEESPVSIDQRRHDLPAGLIAVVHRLIARSPHDRQQTAADVARELAPFAAGANLAALYDRVSKLKPPAVDPSTASTEDIITSAHEDTIPPVVTPPIPARQPLFARAVQWMRGHRLAAAASLLPLLVGIVWALLPSPSPSPPPIGQAPLSPMAMVGHPTKIDGVESWTVETIAPRGYIEGMAYNPDGSRLATYSQDGSIRIWDTATGELSKALLGQYLPTTTGMLAWSFDGKHVAVVDRLRTVQTVKVWDVPQAKIAATWRLGGDNLSTEAIAFSPRDHQLAIAQGDRLSLWQAKDGKLKGLWEAPQQASGRCGSVAWSPDGTQLATLVVGSGSRLHLWEAASGQHQRTIVLDAPGVNVAWSPDGTQLAVGGVLPHRTQIYQAADGAKAGDFPGGMVAWFKEGLAVAHEVYDVKSAKVLRTVPANPDVWSPDGQRCAREFAAGKDGIVLRLFDATGKPPREIKRIPASIHGGARSSDGTLQMFDGLIWDCDTGTVIGRYDRQFSPLKFSPDNALVTASMGNKVHLMGGRDGHLLSTQFAMNGAAHLTAWSPDGAKIYGVRGKKIVAVAAKTGADATIFEGEAEWIADFRVSPDGKHVSAGFNSGITLWDTATGKLVRDVRFPDKLGDQGYHAWSNDSRRLAAAVRTSAGESKLLILNADTGELIRSIELPASPDGYFGNVRWTPDDRQIMVGSIPSSWRWYDVATGTLAREISTARIAYVSAFIGDDNLNERMIVTALPDRNGLAVGVTGHYRGPEGVESQIVYVVQTADGQQTLKPEEFAKKYGWVNDPNQVGQLK